MGAGGLGRAAPAARRVTVGPEEETLRFLKRSKAETRRELSGAMEFSSCLVRTSAVVRATPSTSGFLSLADLDLASVFLAAGFLAAGFFVVVFFSISNGDYSI